MMMQSDYHFGNPASAVDAVVAHLRRGKPIYPNECWRGIVEHYYPNATLLPDTPIVQEDDQQSIRMSTIVVARRGDCDFQASQFLLGTSNLKR